MKIGDTVYLRTGDDTNPKLIVGVLKRKGSTTYELRTGKDEATWHFDFEFSYDKPQGKQIKGLRNC